jgi:hypothetical protein
VSSFPSPNLSVTGFSMPLCFKMQRSVIENKVLFLKIHTRTHTHREINFGLFDFFGTHTFEGSDAQVIIMLNFELFPVKGSPDQELVCFHQIK